MGARIVNRRRNAADELPFGEWIPTHAVRFNDDGTVSLMTEEGRMRNASVKFGSYDSEGDFHPWRGSPDYQPSLAGETGPKYKHKGKHPKYTRYKFD